MPAQRRRDFRKQRRPRRTFASYLLAALGFVGIAALAFGFGAIVLGRMVPAAPPPAADREQRSEPSPSQRRPPDRTPASDTNDDTVVTPVTGTPDDGSASAGADAERSAAAPSIDRRTSADSDDAPRVSTRSASASGDDAPRAPRPRRAVTRSERDDRNVREDTPRARRKPVSEDEGPSARRQEHRATPPSTRKHTEETSVTRPSARSRSPQKAPPKRGSDSVQRGESIDN